MERFQTWSYQKALKSWRDYWNVCGRRRRLSTLGLRLLFDVYRGLPICRLFSTYYFFSWRECWRQQMASFRGMLNPPSACAVFSGLLSGGIVISGGQKTNRRESVSDGWPLTTENQALHHSVWKVFRAAWSPRRATLLPRVIGIDVAMTS